jgi:hypothetical protein
MTVHEAATQLANEMRERGVVGVFILERALLQLLEAPDALYLKLQDGRLLHDTPGYERLRLQDEAVLERFKVLLADIKGAEVAQ